MVTEKKGKNYTPFPPAQTPSKKDLQIESGEYFLNQQQRDARKLSEKRESAKETKERKRKDRESEFVASNAGEFDADTGRYIRQDGDGDEPSKKKTKKEKKDKKEKKSKKSKKDE